MNNFSIGSWLSSNGVYWNPTESKLLNEGVGGFSVEELPDLLAYLSFKLGKSEDDIEDSDIVKYHKELKIKELKIRCTEEIHAGFYCCINGTCYKFGLNAHDQSNLNSQLNRLGLKMSQLILERISQEEFDSSPMITWKTLNQGVVSLTNDQFIQVTDEAEKHIRAQQTTYWIREHQTLNAETSEDLLGIQWEVPEDE